MALFPRLSRSFWVAFLLLTTAIEGACGGATQMAEPDNLIGDRPSPAPRRSPSRRADDHEGSGYDGPLAQKIRRLRGYGLVVPPRPSPWQGDWVAKATVPVRWDGSIKLEGGQGDVEYEFAVSRERCAADGGPSSYKTTDRLCENYQICAIRTPPFQTNNSLPFFGGRHFRTGFKETLFKVTPPGPFIAAAQGRGEVSGWELGARSESSLLALMIGYQSDNPEAAWPARANEFRDAVDMDQDGHIGVSLFTETRSPYEQPPVNWNFTAVASSYHIASRILFRVQTVLLGPDDAVGTLEMVIIDGQVAIQTRILGCVLGDGNICNGGQSGLADENILRYRPNGHAAIRMRRWSGSGAPNCTNVRDEPL